MNKQTEQKIETLQATRKAWISLLDERAYDCKRAELLEKIATANNALLVLDSQFQNAPAMITDCDKRIAKLREESNADAAKLKSLIARMQEAGIDWKAMLDE